MKAEIIEGFSIFECIARNRARLWDQFNGDLDALDDYLIERSKRSCAEYIAQGGTVTEEKY
jgi:hypothetical protein